MNKFMFENCEISNIPSLPTLVHLGLFRMDPMVPLKKISVITVL